MARRSHRTAGTTVGEVLVWLLFFALLVPAGFVGWAIGHYTAGGTQTVTRTVGASPARATTAGTTAAASTTAGTTTAGTTTAAATTAQTTTAVAAAGSPAKGKTVFADSGCGVCHTFKPAGTSAAIGPDLDTRPAQDAKKTKMPLAAFIRQSIVSPDAYVAPGYSKGIMPSSFGKQLSKTQLTDLVAFIAAGSH